ncbi:MAG: Gx transporter family protein [Atopobiaceae bacterium]|nr:Gx transporter family protein [Atopobiaceae bacterium]
MNTTENQVLTDDEVSRWSHIGALAALAMVLGYLETFVPIPIPGVKLGLANVAVLLALAHGDVWGGCWVALVKVLAAGLLFGSPVTMAYSAAGTVLSLLVMVPLSRLRTMRLWMVSIAGARAHEVGQILVAQALLGTSLVWYSAPPLLLAGCVTGAFCGLVAQRSLALLEQDADASPTPDAQPPSAPLRPAGTAKGGRVNPKLALLILVLFSVVALRVHDLPVLAACLVLSAAACVWAQVSVADVVKALRPVALICAITLVAQLASAPPQDALKAAAVSALRLLSLVGASLAFVRAQSSEELLEGVRWLLAPLRALGVNTAGPILALNVALELLPLLASGFRLEDNSVVSLSQLVVNAYRTADRLVAARS